MTTTGPTFEAMPVTDVRRVEDSNGSHIEPPCDEAWGDLAKLQWAAAVASIDTGLRIEVSKHPNNYGINIRRPTGGGLSSCAVTGFHDAWTYLSGISIGATAVKRLTLPAEAET